MIVVLDTNVIVSALLSPHGSAARVLDIVLAGRVTVVFDDRIMDEYWQVLRRRRFGFAEEDVKALLDFIRSEGRAVSAPPLKVALPDLDDLMFVEVAVAAGADAIVTGNRRHFPAGCYDGIRVVSPVDLLSLL